MKRKRIDSPTTLDNLNRMQHDAYEYIDRFYTDEEPEKRKNYGEFLEAHHSIKVPKR